MIGSCNFAKSEARRVFVVKFIIALNIVVFLLWKTPSEDVFLFMAQNFLVSWDALAQGRIWTLVTSVFSHNLLFHLLINMFVLQSFGRVLEMHFNARSFLKFYLLAGIIASLSHALVSAWILGRPDLPALGASGAVAGVMMLFSLMYPRERILIFAIIPVPALWGAFAFVALDIWGLVAQSSGGGLPIGHGAHLGGAFTGAVYYFLVRRRRTTPKLAP